MANRPDRAATRTQRLPRHVHNCLDYLSQRGHDDVVKSSCIGCPYSGNSRLRWIRDTDPDAWTELVEFDKAIRNGSPHAIAEKKPLRGQFFVHRSLRPLDQVDLDSTRGRTGADEDDPDGCSPFSCRSGDPPPHSPHDRPAPAEQRAPDECR